MFLMSATDEARWTSRSLLRIACVDLGVDRHDLLVLAALELVERVLQARLPEHALALVVGRRLQARLLGIALHPGER
jgi:hypothetical protein